MVPSKSYFTLLSYFLACVAYVACVALDGNPALRSKWVLEISGHGGQTSDKCVWSQLLVHA